MSKYPIREGKEDDLAFIVNTWCQCNKGTRMALDAGPVYTQEQKRLINRILMSKLTRTVVMHVPDSENAILGFAVGKPGLDPAVYYVYVKADLRRQKLACAMLAHLLNSKEEELACLKVQYSHRPMVPSVKPPPAWQYNPYRNLDADVLQARSL